MQFTAGGNISKHNGQTSIEKASIETAKLLVNSVLSTKDAKFMAMDISNFYIQIDLEDYQYIYFPIDMIPQDIIDKYNLTTIVSKDGYCYATRNQKSDVRITRVRVSSKHQTQKNIRVKRTYTIKIHTRIICTQDKRYSLFISSGRFCSEITLEKKMQNTY